MCDTILKSGFSFKFWQLLVVWLYALCIKAAANNAGNINMLNAHERYIKTPEYRFSTLGETPVSVPVSAPVSGPVSTPVSAPFSPPATAPASPPASPPFFVSTKAIRFNYTGGVQTYTVPVGVTSLNITLFGAQGGTSFGPGGYGAMISSSITVVPGQLLFIFVGGVGTPTAGGYNGGGAPDTFSTQYTRGGGGATDIRVNEQSLSNRILVAGGGGAGGYCGAGPGGGGGYLVGLDGTICMQGYPGGKGGTQVGGGAFGDGENTCTTESNGVRGQGGRACHSASYEVGNYGGGGGGGYFGGGGSFAAGAGGGSSYSAYPVLANQTAVNVGDGYAVIEVLDASPPSPVTTASPSKVPFAAPSAVPSVVPSLRPSAVPSYTRTRSPTRAGYQVYISSEQVINGVSWGQFEAEPAATPAWIESVSRACAGARASLVRVNILFKKDVGNKRRLNEAFDVSNAEGLGVKLVFNITYTQEDFAPYSSVSVNSTAGLLKSNFQSFTRNGTFTSIFRSELTNRGAAEPFVTAVAPAEPHFQSGQYVDSTGLDPTARPVARPTMSPTQSPTLYDRAPTITEVASNVSSSSIALNVAFTPTAVYPGTLYCAALPGSTEKLTSINQITTAGFSSAYLINATTASVKITGLSALTSYATYCYVETSRGVGNSLLEVQETRRAVTTTCCKPLTFTNAPATLYGDPSRYSVSQSSQYVFTYSLGSAPSNTLTVTPEFRSSQGQLVNSNIITTSPVSVSFTSQSTALSSSFVITTGAGFVTDNFVLTLGLTGGSVAQYRSVSTNVRVLSANAPPSPPVLQSAIFSSDGSSITATFDSATNQAATTVTPCSTLFVFDGNNKASCRWISNTQVRITFAAVDDSTQGARRLHNDIHTFATSEGTTRYAEPLDIFGLRSGVIKANCASNAVCTDYVASAAQNITLAAPSNPVTPNVVLKVPTTVSSCAEMTIDASQSTGHGGRSWRFTRYLVRTLNPDVFPTALVTLLNGLGNAINQKAAFPPAGYTVPNIEYTVTLTLTNFLGVSSSASAVFTVLDNPNLPTVQVLGGTSFTIKPSDTLTIYSSSSKPACGEKNVVFSTRWQVFTTVTGAITSRRTLAQQELFTDSTLVSSAVTTSRDPSILVLPPLTLSPGTRYRAVVTTTASASSTQPSVSATAEAQITVQNGLVIARVSGGDSRLVPATEVVRIDASSSYDENLGSAAPSVGLTFAWTCTYLTASQFGASCSNVFVSGTTTQPSVSVQGLLLDSTQIYSFTVRVASADGRSASKSVTLQVQPPESSTNLVIGTLPRKVNANSRLAVTVQLVAGYALTGMWSASIDGTAVSLSTATPLTESFTAVDVQSPGIAFPLLVSSNAQSAGSVITFRFTATRTGTSFTSVYASFAEASVVINAPPSSGAFTVTPSDGAALSTVFRFLANGYTDDASDLPLSYMFSYIATQESSALVVQPLSGINSASVLLPAGSESLDYTIDSQTTVYDVFGASATATSSVRVTPVSNASAVTNYLNESLTAFAATGDTSFAFNLVNNVATTFSTVNCSVATAAFCASKNRRPCATEPNSCSSCLEGYSGVSGNSNAKCLLNTENRRLSEQVLYGTSCASNDDCLLGNCTSSICVVPPLLCPSSVIDSVCSGNGQCAYTDTTGKTFPSCTVLDTQCFADCFCDVGWGGYDCSLTSEELLTRDDSRRSLCDTILTVSQQSNPSTVLLDNLVGSLSALFQPAEIVSNATIDACTAALTTITTLAEEGYFINGAEDTIPNLLDLTGRFAQAGNDSSVRNSSSLNEALTKISTGVLLSMVNGQSDRSVASANIKFTASKSLVRQFGGLISPTTSQEAEYGVESKASLELTGDGAAAACDAGKGYVDVSLTQWGTVPFGGASQLIAPQIQFQSQVSVVDSSRRTLSSSELRTLATSVSPSYFVVLQFNQPQTLLPAPEENVTFPECTVYDAASGQYVSCNGCTVSSYTNTNVTYGCTDITQLCSSDSSARRLAESPDLGRNLANFDDYIDDGGSFGSQTSVTSIQYSALVSTFTSVLSANVFALNFAAAKVTLSVVLVLVGIIILGFIYFRAWDVHDHNMFLYKFKEPPHLRVKKKYQSKQLSWKDSSQNFLSTMGKKTSKSNKETGNDSSKFDFGAELGIEYNMVYPEETEETEQVDQASPTSKKSMEPMDGAVPSAVSGTDRSDGSAFTPSARPDPFAKSDTMKNCAFNPTAKTFNTHDDEMLVHNAVENYIRNVIPIKNLAGAPTTTLSTLLGLIAYHPLSNLFFSPSLQVTRVQRWMMVCLDIMCGLFVDTLFFSTFYPNAGECEDYFAQVDCETPQNNALNANLCEWKVDLTTQNGGDCDAVPPPSDIMFVMVLVMITLVVTVPIVFLFDFIMTQYCSKRPNFALWGYNTEAVLGASTQKLGEFNTEKHAAPIVSLRRQIRRVRQLDGAAVRFHSPLYLSETHTSAPVETSPDEVVNEEARAVYEEFIGVKEEVDMILQDAITYLTVTLRNQNVPWKTSAASGHTAATAVLLNQDKIKAIEDLLGVFADGTPARLTLLERLMYGTAKGKLRAKILFARRKAAQIREMMENLGETELLSKDQALTQFFVLEQFSIFKQYALRSQLFSFAVTTALPVDPGVWIASWAFLIGGLLFFVYWTLAWGVSTSDVTLKAWGINFAIATAQELFIIQVFRLYIVYMISNVFVKPQLTAIYRTLQRLSIEYVQDELPDAFGVIKVVQHVSPACRVASMKVSDNLAAGQILRHIDDRDIRNFRQASEVGLPILFLSVVAVPVIIGLASDAAGDIALDTLLPSVFSMLVVGHYMLYQISPVAVILPYSFILFVLLTHSYVSSKAEKRLFEIRQRHAAQKGSSKLGGWHIRSGSTFDKQESFLGSVQRYFKSMGQRYVSSAVDTAAVVTYYATHWTELKNILFQALFPLSSTKIQTNQWRLFNAPQYMQGEIIDAEFANAMGQTAAMALTLPVIPGRVQAMSVNVTAPWDREEAVLQRKTCGDSLLQLLCPESRELEPIELAGAQRNAMIGNVLKDGTHQHAKVNGQAGMQFKEKYGFCSSSEDAIVKVILSYQKQKISGSLYFLSLLDETLLLGVDAPVELLRYEGHVHVRDLALMLEEILYFYRPENRALTEIELQFLLRAYDSWVTKEAVPVQPEVLKTVNFLLTRSTSGGVETPSIKITDEETAKDSINRGYFQQHKLVSVMHFGRVAEALLASNTTNGIKQQNADASSAKLSSPDGRSTSCWSEIRRVLDSEQEKLISVENSLMGAALRSLRGQQKLSIAARLESRKFRNEVEPEKVHIAHATVPFHLFVHFFLSQKINEDSHGQEILSEEGAQEEGTP